MVVRRNISSTLETAAQAAERLSRRCLNLAERARQREAHRTPALRPGLRYGYPSGHIYLVESVGPLTFEAQRFIKPVARVRGDRVERGTTLIETVDKFNRHLAEGRLEILGYGPE